MKGTDKFNFMIGLFMMIVGFIGLVWKSIEAVIYRFQNPDYTEYRVMMERPEFLCMERYLLQFALADIIWLRIMRTSNYIVRSNKHE